MRLNFLAGFRTGADMGGNAMKRVLMATAAAVALMTTSAVSADKVKVGFMARF